MTARSGRGRFRLTDSRRFRVSSGAKIQNRYKRPTNGPETSRATCRKSETVGDGFKFRLSAEHPGTDKRNRSIIGITRPTGAFLKTVNFHRTFESLCSSIEKKKDFLRRPGTRIRYDPNGRESQRRNRQFYGISLIAWTWKKTPRNSTIREKVEK